MYFFSYISFAQSDYEKYYELKERREHPTLYPSDTDTVYVEVEKDPIIIERPDIRFNLYFGSYYRWYDPWHYDYWYWNDPFWSWNYHYSYHYYPYHHLSYRFADF